MRSAMRVLVVAVMVAVAVPASAFNGRPVSDLQFLPDGSPQRQGITHMAAGSGMYLVAWGDGAVRAARIDRRGNYLDGDGIVVAPAGVPAAIAWNGSSWMIVWTTGSELYGTAVFPNGRTGQPVRIGAGAEAQVQWTGSEYLVVHGSNTSLSTRLLPGGSVSPSGTTGAPVDAVLSMAGGEPVIFWVSGAHEISGQILDHQGAPTRGAPVVIRPWPTFFPLTGLRAASDGTHVMLAGTERGFTITSQVVPYTLVVKNENGLEVVGGASLPANGTVPLLSFNGEFFEGAWVAYFRYYYGILAVRFNLDGSWRDAVSVDPPVGVPGMSVASGPGLPLLIGLRPTGTLTGPLLFKTDLAAPSTIPTVPIGRCASQDSDGAVLVRFEPAPESFGTEIHLELADGQLAILGHAPSSATSARVSLRGLPPGPIRLRSWNRDRQSEPSAPLELTPTPSASMRSALRTCPGAPVTIAATLSGVPPFTVRWSDGFVQPGVTVRTVSRTVMPMQDTTLSITSVESSCARSTSRETIRITVDPPPSIADQTREVRVKSGDRAMLTVIASSDEAQYQWFEGAPGDTSHPLGWYAPSFTTPPLLRTMRYWVRVTGSCGSVDSEPIAVQVTARQRSVRH